MTGVSAFLLDEQDALSGRLNTETVAIPLENTSSGRLLKPFAETHLEVTGSRKAPKSSHLAPSGVELQVLVQTASGRPWPSASG